MNMTDTKKPNRKRKIPFVGCIVMVLWGVLGNAWNISWIAVVVGGILMAILSIINSNLQKDKNNQDKK